MKRLIVLICLLSNIVMHTFASIDIVDDIARCFATGNSKELAVHLSSTISLSLLEENNTYSKSQTEILLRNFFDKHNFRGAKITHRMEPNANNWYVVLETNTVSQQYRVSISLKNFNSKYLITDIRIDKMG
ncbi:DUF4783 domain-containing protein [Olivibacter sp. SDN3]|uniref:DUF4783 domain-containing protein n=1 Tax=Olivibacter sp. SDN3 TaxID=2764720 RepID=UPI001651161C|nr:DUF4783 domain-containing protein [Olivibacter sp. SDN3]QNL49108.1 DUF4783 domain-containing protein [Olivibacter sp. SDN3]